MMPRTANHRIEDARLLVVDDQEANTHMLERMLRRAGFAHVRSTTDPERALGIYAEFRPDLILLDLHMPKLDGFAVMTQLNRQIPSDDYLPILVLTADANPDAKQRALSAGAKDFLTKPFERVEVLLRIKNLLETRFLHLQLRSHNQLLDQRVRERTAELEAALEERRMLLSRLVTVQEEERQRIANDVHDDSVQVMVAAQMQLHVLGRTLSDPDQLSAVERLSHTVRQSIGRLRKLLFELRPPALDDDGLAAALRIYLEESLAEGGCAFELVDRLREEPPKDTRTVVYRIAQEVLVNTRKHARAQKIDVLIENSEGGFHVVIRDDGIGFRPEDFTVSLPGHLGLASVRERAQMAGGWCRVESAPGEGTTVEFLVQAHERSSGVRAPDEPSGSGPGADSAPAIRVEASR